MDEIDELIQIAGEILEQENVTSLTDVSDRINALRKPSVDYQAISQLTTLCLYYEDMLSKRKNFTDHSLFANISKSLNEKRIRYKLFFKKYEENADTILTSKQCLKYVRWFHKNLCLLEQAVNSNIS